MPRLESPAPFCLGDTLVRPRNKATTVPDEPAFHLTFPVANSKQNCAYAGVPYPILHLQFLIAVNSTLTTKWASCRAEFEIGSAVDSPNQDRLLNPLLKVLVTENVFHSKMLLPVRYHWFNRMLF